MQSCRRHNDGNMIGAKFGNNYNNSRRSNSNSSSSNLKRLSMCAWRFSRNMHFICCCGITIKQSKLEIMLKMHLPFEGSHRRRASGTIKTNAIYIALVCVCVCVVCAICIKGRKRKLKGSFRSLKIQFAVQWDEEKGKTENGTLPLHIVNHCK